MAVFGRDSLITGLQTLLGPPWHRASAPFAISGASKPPKEDPRATRSQARSPTSCDIGELAHFRAFPSPYYGTADATPLYLITLHEAWKWTGDRELVESHLEIAERCLEWIDRYGDMDGDGFQEYQARSPRGYENMGWKDATDAVVYPGWEPGEATQGAVRASGIRLRCLAADGGDLRLLGKARPGDRAPIAKRSNSRRGSTSASGAKRSAPMLSGSIRRRCPSRPSPPTRATASGAGSRARSTPRASWRG